MATGIILSALVAVTTLIIMLFHKRVTMPAAILIIGLSSVPCIIYSLMPDHIVWLIIIPILCMIGWIAFAFRFKDIDYNKRVLSLAPNMNKITGGRVIGRCFPYYSKQLKYNNSTIVQSDLSLNGGTIMTGSSGSGKTRAIENMIKQDVLHGKSVVYINFKGDKDTSEEIIDGVSDRVRVYELSWDTCNFTYDPLINLDDAGRVEAILNMRRWSLEGGDDHYKTGTQLFLQKTIKEFDYKSGNYLREYYNFLRTYTVQRELYDSYNTVMKLLELTITSNVGSKIFSNSGDRFDFASDEQYVLIVSFTSSTKALGTSITSLMLRDLMEVGTRSKYDPSLCLYIDEFGSCESPTVVKDILEKGRSCGISAVISMQDLSQMIINTNAPFLDSVLGTVNSYIIFAGSTKNGAEKMSGTQIYDIDNLLMSLRKPVNGKPPTAVFISKYPVFGKGGTEVYRFIPHTVRDIKSAVKDGFKDVESLKDDETDSPEPDNYEESETLVSSDKSDEEDKPVAMDINDISNFL